jgi:hypothetical protein
MMRCVFVQYVLAMGLLCCAQGCGGDGLERVPIQGVIKAQGSPLANAVVQFTPQEGTPGEGALGMSDAEGKFTVISSRRDDSGVPPGKYSVRVSRFVGGNGAPLPPDATQADHPDAKESVPAPYSTPNSPLRVTIATEGGLVEIDIPVKIKGSK